MKGDKILDGMMESSTISKLGLTRSAVKSILDSYHDAMLKTLLEEGHIELSNGMIIEVVELLDRVHVLRGITYNSSRKYKLKLTMEDNVYKDIESYYEKLREEIG